MSSCLIKGKNLHVQEERCSLNSLSELFPPLSHPLLCFLGVFFICFGVFFVGFFFSFFIFIFIWDFLKSQMDSQIPRRIYKTNSLEGKIDHKSKTSCLEDSSHLKQKLNGKLVNLKLQDGSFTETLLRAELCFKPPLKMPSQSRKPF